MPSRTISLPRRATLASLLCALAAPAGAQIIQVKTLPVADGEQWRFFPSSNSGLAGLSIALRDSLGDPFDNPAKGSRIAEFGRGLFFGSPTAYSMTKHAGGGRTLPFGGIMRMGSTFGGLMLAIQEIDRPETQNGVAFIPPGIAITADGAPLPTPAEPSRQNRFAFGTIGHLFARSGFSIGASAQYSGLNNVDGVDLLYAGSRNIDQHGSAMNVRFGALKEWSGGRALEGMVLHDRFNMTHDVTWLDPFWDPNTRTAKQMARFDHNLDRTNLWGVHLGYSQPLAASGWRVGGIVTTNLMSHPKLPDYQIAQVTSIPWDPGHTAAYDFGVGVAKVKGLTTFGIDAILEPIRTHTWGETPDTIFNSQGIVPAGGKTTENWFHFSNIILRTGAGRDIPFDTLRASLRSLRIEGGIALRAIAYNLDQTDHVQRTDRQQNENWMEWTRTWGVALRFSDLELRYAGRWTTGTGRPGVFSSSNVVFAPTADVAISGRNFLSAPSGATTLTPVAVATHQFSVSVPVR